MPFNLMLPHILPLDVLEIIIIAILIYYIGKALKGTRAITIGKGLLILVSFYFIAAFFQMYVIETFLLIMLVVSTFAILILFQPEIKRGIEWIGTHTLSFKTVTAALSKEQEAQYFPDRTIDEIVEACRIMSEKRTGALIVIRRGVNLDDIDNTGIPINADISSQLLLNIFEKNTPLHDGAITVYDDKIRSAICILPLTQSDIDMKYGTRHRAALGMSENSDSCIVVVSEETGGISVMCNGGKHIIAKDSNELRSILKEQQQQKGVVISQSEIKLRRVTRNIFSKLSCVLVAIALWFGVTILADPVTTVKYTVPISPINESAILDIGKIYKLESDAVPVTISARKSELAYISENIIHVYADLSKLSYTNTAPLSCSVDDIVECTPTLLVQGVKVALDDVTQINVPIEYIPVGVPVEGYYAGDISGMEAIPVQCSASIAKNIDKAVVEVNISNVTHSFTSKNSFVIYDKNGDIIPITSVSTDVSDIEYHVTLSTSKTIPIRIQINELLYQVYDKIEAVTDVSSINIIGEESTLSGIDEYVVSIDNIDITGDDIHKATQKKDIALPDGISLAADTGKTIYVEITITPSSEKNIVLRSKNIEVRNLSDGLKAIIESDNIDIHVIGSQESVDAVSISNIGAYIDASSLDEGNYNLPIRFADGVKTDAVVISVRIEKA